jgi:hypothetical protein
MSFSKKSNVFKTHNSRSRGSEKLEVEGMPTVVHGSAYPMDVGI